MAISLEQSWHYFMMNYYFGYIFFLSLEINLSIVAAVLTIVGYSMNDTVVILIEFVIILKI